MKRKRLGIDEVIRKLREAAAIDSTRVVGPSKIIPASVGGSKRTGSIVSIASPSAQSNLQSSSPPNLAGSDERGRAMSWPMRSAPISPGPDTVC